MKYHMEYYGLVLVAEHRQIWWNTSFLFLIQFDNIVRLKAVALRMQQAPFMLFLWHDLSMPWSMNDEAHNRGTNGTDDLCPKWSSKSNNDPRHLFTMRSSWLLNDDMSHLGISAGVDLDENKPYKKRRFWLCLERRLDATVGLLDNVEINHWRMSQCVLVWAVVRLLLGEASTGLLA